MPIRRPCVWLCTLFILWLCGVRMLKGEDAVKKLYPYDSLLQDGQISATVCGVFYRAEPAGTSSYRLYLRKATLYVEGQNPTEFSHFLVYLDTMPEYLPGYRLRISGQLSDFSAAANPGQFDAKAYYREQMLFYCLFGEQSEILSAEKQPLQSFLYQLQQSLSASIDTGLPRKEAGIMKAVLLGEKSQLDSDVKQLYQKNGIGHLLAISGLHITILCMGLYRFLLWCRLPRPAAVPFSLFFLYCYGVLTGFGISTCRAIIMMVLFLLAELLQKSYDLPSALAVSALVTLLGKPYALTSCSFLLSYMAVLGIALVLPVLQECIWGDADARRERRRKKRRRNRELKAASGWRRLNYYHYIAGEAVLELLHASAAIQLATLPVVLYFFYEVPLNGIILNILVLPFVSLLIFLGVLATAAGFLSPLLSRFFFGGVYGILQAYEWLCHAADRLPAHTVILGRPAMLQLVVYAVLLLFTVYARQYRTATVKTLIVWAFAVIFLIFPKPHPDMMVTFLDVGQGDGIFMQSPTGTTCLIDGGSTSEKEIGTYRLLPFLKSQGVARLDYMVMTHADEDHISGQLELLAQAGKSGGVAIHCLLLPEPAASQRAESGYQKMLRAAALAKVPVRYIHAGDVLREESLTLRCIHPPKEYETDSANAYSTTLAVSYGKTKLLLCGDLEGDGEERVMEILRREQTKFDILKVSHHGSKYSTDVDFLKQAAPELAIISCGKNNRYGHPHKELLERLENAGVPFLQTPYTGAITLYINGFTYRVQSFL